MYDDKNASYTKNESANLSNFSDSPFIEANPERPKRVIKNIILDDSSDIELSPTPTRLIAGRGQKTAVDRFEKIKS